MDHITSVPSEETQKRQPDPPETNRALSTESNTSETIPENDTLTDVVLWEWDKFFFGGP